MVLLNRTKMDLAIHEVSHAGYAQVCGMQVECLTLSPEPSTTLCLPTDLPGLRLRWQASPAWALHDVIHIAGTYGAPYALGFDAFRDSNDWHQLARWQRAWTALKSAPGQEPPLAWDTIIRLAWADVARWGGRPDAQAALETLAVRVAGRRFVSGRTWLTLWHSDEAIPLWSDITGKQHPTIFFLKRSRDAGDEDFTRDHD